jgi:hypothetical protein
MNITGKVPKFATAAVLGWSSTAGCPTVVTHELDTNERAINEPLTHVDRPPRNLTSAA